MTPTRIALLTLLTMAAFAGNSVLCRLALGQTGIDAATFTSVRLLSGAMALWLIVRWRSRWSGTSAAAMTGSGNWLSALALFSYAAAFSFAYLSLTAATGALLLFGAVQTTMIAYGIWTGERLHPRQWAGLLLALAGLLGLLLPGLSAPPPLGSALMLVAGAAWGAYSLRGRGAGDPTHVTAGNFARATLPALALSLLSASSARMTPSGVGYALASGVLASGIGYALWYAVLPGLRASSAATVQLSVPVIAALGGIVFLDEAISWRFVLASLAILGGIALILMSRSRPPA